MSISVIIRLSVAFCFAVAPYLILYMAFCSRERQQHSLYRQLFTGTAIGTAGFILASTIATQYSSAFYYKTHIFLLIAGLATITLQYLRAGFPSIPRPSSGHNIIIGILLMALAVRFLPIMLGGESLGAGDARFHNIIAQKILQNGRISSSWLPFAQIDLMYPQGMHVLVAFLANTAHASVHNAFNFLFPVIGMLTTGIIYLIARSAFGTNKSANWAAACYAFIALWGSLDYYRWGGLPNALGMLFLCIIVLTLLEYQKSDKHKTLTSLLIASVCIPAILLTHHYTLIIITLVLVSGGIFTADRRIRTAAFGILLTGMIFSAPLLIQHYFKFIHGISETSVLVFREPMRTIIFYINNIGLIFATVFILAIVISRKTAWNARQIFVFAWMAGLFSAFVFLEYIYRAGVLITTQGKDCFSCMTSSRMITNMVYPMSILCGFIPASSLWRIHYKRWITALCIVTTGTSITAIHKQINVGVFPQFQQAGLWLSNNTPTNCMIVGSFPHLEYLSQRETSNPPLPASEQRNHPYVTWKSQITSFNQWAEWQDTKKRSVYFVIPADKPPPPNYLEVYTNKIVSIFVSPMT